MDLGLDIAGLTSNEVSTQAARASKTAWLYQLRFETYHKKKRFGLGAQMIQDNRTLEHGH